MIIVSDSSAISCLAELGELDLLQRLYGTVTITATVHKEACYPHAPEALRRFFDHPPAWLVILPDVQPFLEETHALDLSITGAAGMLCDAARVGLIDFEDTFRRLVKTRFHLSPAIVETLRQRHQSRSSPPGQ